MKKILYSAIALFVGAVGLTSCNQSDLSNLSTPQQEEYIVDGEAYLMEENGNLTPIELPRGLRAEVANDKGTITGLGKYYTNQEVTVTAKRKTPYMLYSLYVKGDAELTQEKGLANTTGTVGKYTKKKDESVAIKFNVTKNTKFTAVFINSSTGKLSYEALPNVQVDKVVSSKSASTKSLNNQSFKAYRARILPNGSVVGWDLISSDSYDWTLDKTGTASWLTINATPSNGNINLSLAPYIAKAPARTTTFTIYKSPKYPGSGDVTAGSKAERTYTVTQGSYWEENMEPGTFTYGDGTTGTIPTALSYDYPATGGTKDFTSLDRSFRDAMVVDIPVYVDGAKTSQVVKKNVSVEFSAPTVSWVAKSGNTYVADANDGSAKRITTVKASFKVDNTVIKTTTITLNQANILIDVDGEIE